MTIESLAAVSHRAARYGGLDDAYFPVEPDVAIGSVGLNGDGKNRPPHATAESLPPETRHENAFVGAATPVARNRIWKGVHESSQAGPIRCSIDVHHHILPREYIDALAGLEITRSIGVPFPTWSVKNDLEQMDRLGVQSAVASFSTPAANVPGTADARSLARLCNELMAGMVKTYPRRYGGFATLPPLHDVEGALRELDYALDTLGLVGVELTSNYDFKYLGDSSFEEVYGVLNANKAVVHVHPTDPPGVQSGIPAAVMDAPFDTTRAAFSLICSGVMERYPDIVFILSHGGGTLPYLSYRLAKMAPYVWGSFKKNAPKGFDEYLGRFYYDTAIVGPHAFRYLVSQVGASHVVVGTDHPFAGSMVSAQCLEAVRASAEISDRERKAILETNALALIPGLGKTAVPDLNDPHRDKP